MKTTGLNGPALDWAVAQCDGLLCFGYCTYADRFSVQNSDGLIETYAPSFLWDQGGPIIEREKITPEWTGENWMAYIRHDDKFFGPTPLIAAMRCYVASKLGDEVEVPEEFL